MSRRKNSVAINYQEKVGGLAFKIQIKLSCKILRSLVTVK